MWATGPSSLLQNMALGAGSQHSLRQAMVRSVLVFSQKVQINGETSLKVLPLLAIPISAHVLPHPPSAVCRSRP